MSLFQQRQIVDSSGTIVDSFGGSGGGGGSGDASAANQTALNTEVGIVTETSPATDTASSGLNGRLQRIAQRLTSLIAQLPASLGLKADAASLSVGLSTEQRAILAAIATEATLALQSAKLPASLGIKADAASLSVGLSTEQRAILAAIAATQGYASSVTLTRTADANAYTANDVLGAATGSTAALTFANIGPGAGEIIITSVSFEKDAAAILSGETSYTLHLYSVTPPSALGDNAAWDLPSGDRASYLGSINLGSPADLGSTLYVATDGVNKQVTLASSSLFGYLVTGGAYTPASAAVQIIKLHAVAV